MRVHGLDRTLQMIAGDSTSSNTGWKAGIIAWVERKIGRKLHWIICQIHTNELGLRSLISQMDGKTTSKDCLSGPLGRLLKQLPSMKTNPNFPAISVGPSLISLPPDVVKSLSSDANRAYLRCQAVRTGVLPRDLSLRKTGKCVHSRWLNTGDAFLELWMKKHGLHGELYARLETIVTYLVSVYFPMFFLIKVKHSFLEGPRHVLHELKLFRLQSPRVQELLTPTLRRSSWNAHSESVLTTMLCSNSVQEREFAVNLILELRGEQAEGDLRPRARKHPELQLNAEKLENMISWEAAKEPVMTCRMSRAEVLQLVTSPLKLPYACVHTQGIERAVKEVTEASESVHGFDRRDGFVRARAEHRELMPILSSKKSLARLVE